MSTELAREVANVSLETQSRYVIKRKLWSFMERIFRVYTPDGQMTMYVKHPLLKLREEFMVYSDETETNALLKVKARQAIAINFSYDITDAGTGQLLGTVQKKGLASILRDKFIILDGTGAEIGYMEETGSAILRRIFKFLPGKHAIFMNQNQVFRFFNKEFNVEMTQGAIDPRFGLACALLALMADARREDRR